MAECIELLIASINQQKSRGPSRCRWHGWQLASPSPNGITNPHQSINPKSTSSPIRTLVLDQNGSQFAASQYRSIGREITAAHRVAPAAVARIAPTAAAHSGRPKTEPPPHARRESSLRTAGMVRRPRERPDAGCLGVRATVSGGGRGLGGCCPVGFWVLAFWAFRLYYLRRKWETK